jgi:predicted GIY-YIG superfamily endonuclease
MYKIACKDDNVKECYVGHTTDMKQRSQRHHTTYNISYLNHRKVYKFIREHRGFDNWEIIELEKYGCESHDAALMREKQWIDYLGATLNSCGIADRRRCLICKTVIYKNGTCSTCDEKNVY